MIRIIKPLYTKSLKMYCIFFVDCDCDGWKEMWLETYLKVSLNISGY